MANINGISTNGSMRIHTRASQLRTANNHTFQEQFRSGVKSGINLANDAVSKVLRPIPGTAALSASLSDASRNLGAGRLDGASSSSMSSSTSADGDMNSLQDEMVRNNQDMLEQQVRVSQLTATYSAKSNMIKALFDTVKNIGSNLR